MRIILNGVRSFVGSHSIPLKPLTLLVGENSAGKSTFLAMADAILNQRYLNRKPKFSLPPYDLGSFDEIASFLGGSRPKTFRVGSDDESNRVTMATYERDEGQPILANLDHKFEDSQLSVAFSGGSLRVKGTFGQATRKRVSAQSEQLEPPTEFNFEVSVNEELSDRLGDDWRYAVLFAVMGHGGSETKVINELKGSDFFELLRGTPFLPLSVPPLAARSIAPVRTRPRRVYDASQDLPDPEGDYIPLLVAKELSKAGSGATAMLKALQKFGAESGLFQNIRTRSLSRKNVWPFQIEVENEGPRRNLIDVGYGVSQALPILVESLLKGERTLLIQQPEVHLHPRAQAALGTFFAELVAQKEHRFVVETHSDYLVDRIRLAVAEKVLAPGDVSILFLERPKTRTRVHELMLDGLGNIIGAPKTYRDFFLREQTRMLSAI